MKNSYFPIYLDLVDEECIVVGGGIIAQRKVKDLLKCKAKVKLISPELNKRLLKLKQMGKIEWIQDTYKNKYIKNCRIIFGTTNDIMVNKRIYNDAEKNGILCNSVDNKKYCRFISPAVITKNEIKVAISTGGAAPSIAAIIKNDIGKNIVNKYSTLVNLLGKYRTEILKMNLRKRKMFWKTVLEGDISKLRNFGRVKLGKIIKLLLKKNN